MNFKRGVALTNGEREYQDATAWAHFKSLQYLNNQVPPQWTSFQDLRLWCDTDYDFFFDKVSDTDQLVSRGGNTINCPRD